MVVADMFNWESVAEALLDTVGQPHYDLWIRPLKAELADPRIVRLLSPNEFHLDYVRRTHATAIETLVATRFPDWQVEFGVGEPLNEPIPVEQRIPASQLEQPTRPSLHPLLNAQYTFASFVVGTSNQVAHASAASVADNLGMAFNPLFLVGSSGLGKTHLLHAIGHKVHRDEPRKRIFCLPAERFMNEYVNAIRAGRSIEFKDKYRKECDLLLIDDVHALAGREGTQEEFFHIFNSLHENGKQIVLTSDKYPRDMDGLEQRLRSRFEWGLIADIQPPDMETRVAIIRSKAELQQVPIPDDVAVFLATLPTSSVRDLEGHLNRLRAFSNFENRTIDLEFARKTLARLMGEPKVINVDDIIKKVSEAFGVRPQDIRSSSRKSSVTVPRHVAMFLAREKTQMSFPEIGLRFGGRNHATVINACDNVRERMLTDPQFAAIVEQIKKTL
jgi:chromosomal replication initiator protein